jgi:hypothetical protein
MSWQLRAILGSDRSTDSIQECVSRREGSMHNCSRPSDLKYGQQKNEKSQKEQGKDEETNRDENKDDSGDHLFSFI